MADEDDVRATLLQFDRAFVAGNADELASCFADDAVQLLLHAEPMEGRPAIRAHWARLFADWDPGAWTAEQPIVEVAGDLAHALSIYAETLVKRTGEVRMEVRGRIAFFLRREPDGEWRITLVMNSHSRPSERIDVDVEQG